jgi:hypothetical protein
MPKDEMEAAKAALEKAKQAETNIYAESLYMAAFNRCTETRPLLQKRKFGAAKALFKEVIELTDRAIAAVPPAKAECKAAAEKLMPEMRPRFEKCSTYVAKRAKRRRMTKLRKEQQKKDEQFIAKIRSFMQQAKRSYDMGKFKKAQEFSEEVKKGFDNFDELHSKISKKRRGRRRRR